MTDKRYYVHVVPPSGRNDVIIDAGDLSKALGAVSRETKKRHVAGTRITLLYNYGKVSDAMRVDTRWIKHERGWTRSL